MNNLKYHIITYGCQMNHSDSERMSGVLEKMGMITTKNEAEADVVVVNACSVRQTAIDRIWGKLNNIEKFKKNKRIYTVLTGCVLPADKPKFAQRFDLYFPIKDLTKLPEKMNKLVNSNNGTMKQLNNGQIKFHKTEPLAPISQVPAAQEHYLQIKPKYENKFSAYVPIMTGCNAYCTYCAVPYTRGREVSRQPEEIIEEIKNLLNQGYKEITLLGQIINKYMVKVNGNLFKFHDLLAKIAQLNDNFWLRFFSSHPKWFSKELIDTINRYENIVEHIHLPVQAGANTTLRRMLRPYKIDEYKNIISYIRKNIPSASITTDVIVGFCGETEEEFEQTKELFRWAKYDMAYISQYSTRAGTKASKTLEDNIPHQVKVQRDKELTKTLEATALANNQKYLNKDVDVLITSVNGGVFGRTRINKNIKLTFDNKHLTFDNLLGTFVKAKVTRVNPWSLEGEIKNHLDIK